jgi:hypothetical protein
MGWAVRMAVHICAEGALLERLGTQAECQPRAGHELGPADGPREASASMQVTIPHRLQPIRQRRSGFRRKNKRVWISQVGGSAEEPPTPEQTQRWFRRMSPPDNEFPAGVGLTAVPDVQTTLRLGTAR